MPLLRQQRFTLRDVRGIAALSRDHERFLDEPAVAACVAEAFAHRSKLLYDTAQSLIRKIGG